MTTDKQVKHIYASVDKAEDGTYTATIVCSNFDKISLGELFDVLEDEVSDTTYVDLPVISELQDPKFMEELNRRVASIKDGSTKTYSIDEVFDRLQKKFPDDKVEVSLNIKTEQLKYDWELSHEIHQYGPIFDAPKTEILPVGTKFRLVYFFYKPWEDGLVEGHNYYLIAWLDDTGLEKTGWTRTYSFQWLDCFATKIKQS